MTIQAMFNSVKKYGYVQDGGFKDGHISHRKNGDFIKENGKWILLPDTTKVAKKLDPSIWGNTEEIKEKAKLQRISNNFNETRKILEYISLKSKAEPLKSSDGLEAELSKKK